MRIPVKYIVQIDNFHVADFIFYWNYYDQPCSLLLQKQGTRLVIIVPVEDEIRHMEIVYLDNVFHGNTHRTSVVKCRLNSL